MALRFSTTPFLNTRQFYYPLEAGHVDTAIEIDVEVVHNHSPSKDQKLLCGDLDATTMSMGKYVLAHQLSHTDVLPETPAAIAAGLTYREGNGVFVPASSPIADPADLAGHRVGMHDTTLAMTYHKAVLDEHFGVDPADVEWVVGTHRELGDWLDSGEIDAAERLNDWYWALAGSDAYRRVYDMPQAWAQLVGDGPLVHLVAVADGRLTPAEIGAFRDALDRSRDYALAHRREVLTALLEAGEDDWTGERTVEAVLPAAQTVSCPLDLGADQRATVRAWMDYADRYGVFADPPLSDERLFPSDKIRK